MIAMILLCLVQGPWASSSIGMKNTYSEEDFEILLPVNSR